MPTARQLLVSKSGYPSGTSTARLRMQAIEAATVSIAPQLEKKVIQYVRAPSASKSAKIRLPQVHVVDNSVMAVQQAFDELMRNIRKGLK